MTKRLTKAILIILVVGIIIAATWAFLGSLVAGIMSEIFAETPHDSWGITEPLN
ncbi:MAG: hypothetical protein FWG68_08805 [Defluviitaleaceae bacterium]|nr:hypothetical protein [Defluviitaleaceae bacterium]